MQNFFSVNSILYLLNLPAFAIYFIMMRFFLLRYMGENKRSYYITLISAVLYLFFYKFILFEKKVFWSDIYPYFLLFLVTSKYIFLKDLLKIPILIFLLAASAAYPMAYLFNVIDMAYNPYLVFVYHSIWAGVLIYCAKKLKEVENNLSTTSHRD